jgi:hypothetical protein
METLTLTLTDGGGEGEETLAKHAKVGTEKILSQRAETQRSEKALNCSLEQEGSDLICAFLPLSSASPRLCQRLAAYVLFRSISSLEDGIWTPTNSPI